MKVVRILLYIVAGLLLMFGNYPLPMQVLGGLFLLLALRRFIRLNKDDSCGGSGFSSFGGG